MNEAQPHQLHFQLQFTSLLVGGQDVWLLDHCLLLHIKGLPATSVLAYVPIQGGDLTFKLCSLAKSVLSLLLPKQFRSPVSSLIMLHEITLLGGSTPLHPNLSLTLLDSVYLAVKL